MGIAKMTQGAVLLLVALTARPAAAGSDDWVRMSGPEIGELLTDRSARYESASQHFYASGRTLYDAGRPSWGYWRVEGDEYCSQWPPGDLWDCYSVDRGKGDMIRFVARDGSTSEGQMLSE